MLWAVERHLDGRPGHALALGTLACLLRPELVPFLGLWSLGRSAREPRLRPSRRARSRCWPSRGSCRTGSRSGVRSTAASRRARSRPGACRWRSALAAGAGARAQPRRPARGAAGRAGRGRRPSRGAAGRSRCSPRRPSPRSGLFVAMTQAGFSGNPRYVLPALAIWAVLAGVGRGAARQCAAGALAPLDGGRPAGGCRASRPCRWRSLRTGSPTRACCTCAPRRTRWACGCRCIATSPARSRRPAGRPPCAALGIGDRQPRAADAPGVGARRAHGEVERLTDERLVFRSSREPLVGQVYLHGRARTARTLARVGTVQGVPAGRSDVPDSRLASGDPCGRRLQRFCREFTLRLERGGTGGVCGNEVATQPVTGWQHLC